MKEFQMIARHYGDRTAVRSQVPLIQHICEGLHILQMTDATVFTARAYCLHPLFQSDADLKQNSELVMTECLDPFVMTLVMEYRHQANSWLSDKVWTKVIGGKVRAPAIRQDGKPTPGPLREVQLMLIADKVQNYKDFLLHHKGTHPRSAELELYFKEWLAALCVSQEQFDSIVQTLIDYERANPNWVADCKAAFGG
jgi:hypothetical protein